MWKSIGRFFAAIGHGALVAARWSSDHPQVVQAVEAAASAASPTAAVAIQAANAGINVGVAIKNAQGTDAKVEAAIAGAPAVVDAVKAVK